MKKHILILFLIISNILISQRDTYKIGTTILNLGMGFNSTVYNTNYSPSFNFSAERGVLEIGPGKLGVGAIVQYQTSNFKYYSNNTTSDGLEYNLKSLNIGLRGTYHPDFLNTKVLDIYGILMFGYSSNQNNTSPFGNFFGTIPDLGPKNAPNIGVCAGGRIYIKPKIGIYGEFGYDVSPIKIGLTAKF